MNKFVKGSAAGATGIALLMGGFGTYALWNDSVAMPDQAIAAGDLSLTAGAAAWTEVSTGQTKTIDPATFRVVPGDKLVMTRPLTVTAVGDNIAGKVSVAQGSLAALNALSDQLVVNVSFTEANETPDSFTAAGDFTGPVNDDVTAKVTIDFTDAAPATQNLSKTLSTTLQDVEFVLTQVRP